MFQSFSRAHSFQRINLHQSPDKINKQIVIGSDSIFEGGLFWHVNVIQTSVVFVVEVNKVLVAEQTDHILATLQHPLRPRSHDALYPGDHSLNVLVEEKHVFGPQLGQDAAQ
jgi:hypothetical protein